MKSTSRPTFLTDVMIASSLLTRLPIPHLPAEAFDAAPRAVWAYPLAGALLGLLAGMLGQVFFALGLPAAVAAGLTLATLMICSGAMHEDGLADTADGFWGGHEKETRLAIMKDSQIGTYGVLALVLVTGLRWFAYSTLVATGLWSMVAIAALSRAAMPLLMHALPHARDFGLSHSVGTPDIKPVVTGLALSSLFAWFVLGPIGLLCTVVVCVTAGVVGIIARSKIGGQTGDCLGATQQLAEVALLLTLLAAWA